MYLELFHGRDNPDNAMEDWGYEGPIIGPFKSVHVTYLSTVRLLPLDSDGDEYWLVFEDGCVRFDSKYYGDFAVIETVRAEDQSRIVPLPKPERR